MMRLAPPRALSLLRRIRTMHHLTRLAWAQRSRIGWRELAVRGARRLRNLDTWGIGEPSPGIRSYERPGPDTVFDVIYAVGFWPGTPKRYRVFNLAEGLSAAGYRTHVIAFDELEDIRRYRWRASTIVLFRAEYDPLGGIDRVIAEARRAGTHIVYDIDDLVFDADRADMIDALHRMSAYERNAQIAAMGRRGRMMRACDFVTVSTAPLARAVEGFGCRAVVVPNSLNREQLEVADRIAAAPPRRGEHIVIAYLSGSRTHQRDFMECETALLDIMERHPRVRFRLVGYLDLAPVWDKYRERIERVDFLSQNDLLHCIAETDINLAPLEPGNPFCEAKSELKFFEAGLIGVPTIASATEPFAAAIEDGISGLLARDEAEWRAALDLLVSSEARRKAIGEAARRRALDLFGPAAVIPREIAALGLPLRRNDPRCRNAGPEPASTSGTAGG
jgi:glycosyltransferase involved in cell wall biosynthesis